MKRIPTAEERVGIALQELTESRGVGVSTMELEKVARQLEMLIGRCT